VRALRAGELAPTELVEAALARELERGVAGATLLGGLPTVVKDLHDVEGVRTTYGSTIFADHGPRSAEGRHLRATVVAYRFDKGAPPAPFRRDGRKG
jgi:Asp-tRNA(Asn)/Glu-tRNA(Gln) amidotransferase A subunit family amidase